MPDRSAARGARTGSQRGRLPVGRGLAEQAVGRKPRNRPTRGCLPIWFSIAAGGSQTAASLPAEGAAPLDWKLRLRYHVCSKQNQALDTAHMVSKPDHEALYAVAEGRAGYFTSAEAASSGIGSQLLSHHARSGAYQRAARGIYRLTRFPASRFEDLVIAWLRAGPRSAISHASALAVYDLGDLVPGQIHVTMPRSGSRRRPGLKLHTAALLESSVVWREGMRVTTVPRTLCDLAFVGFPEDQIRQAVQQAIARGLTNREAMTAEAKTRGRRVARQFERIFAGS